MLLKAMKEYGVRHRPNEMLHHAFEADAASRLLAEGVSQPDVSRVIMAMMVTCPSLSYQFLMQLTVVAQKARLPHRRAECDRRAG